MRVTTRAVLAVVLLAGLPVLAGTVALALVWALALSLGLGRNGLAAGGLVILGVTAVARSRARWRCARHPSPGAEDGIALEEARYPRLWGEVRLLAEAAGTRPPDRIRLAPQAELTVIEETRLLGLLGGTRTMVVGAPLLMGLTQRQVRAVLAHELGHDGARHRALGPVVRRGHQAIAEAARRSSPGSVTGGLLARHARLYDALTLPVRRQQELHADDVSAEVVGPGTAVAALVEKAVIATSWQHYLDEFVAPAHERGLRPSSLFVGFAELCTAPGLQPVLASLRLDPPRETPDLHGSHPPLEQRLARLRERPAEGPRDDGTSALALLDRADVAFEQLESAMYDGTDLVPTPWPELLTRTEAPGARAGAVALFTWAQEVEGRPRTLGDLVRSVHGGRIRDYVRRGLLDPTEDDLVAASTSLLRSAVIDVLVTARGMRVTRTFDTEPRLIDHAGRGLDPGPVVERAVATGDPITLERWLLEQGAPTSYSPAAPTPEDERPSEHTLLAAAAPVSGRGVRVLVVQGGGLVLRRATWRDRLTVLATAGSPGNALLAHLRETDQADIADDRRHLWLPWAAVDEVRVEERRGTGPRLRIRTREGSVHVLRLERATKYHGDLSGSLAEFLGPRLTG